MLILVYNIHKRHILLSTYFQEKENEILSYNNAILLSVLSTGGMICFCVLEVVFYFLYSCKVRVFFITVIGEKFYKWWGKILNFVFYLKNGSCLSRVTQKYLFFKKILSFSAPNSPLKFLHFRVYAKCFCSGGAITFFFHILDLKKTFWN